jgi:serine/threonine protein kinase
MSDMSSLRPIGKGRYGTVYEDGEGKVHKIIMDELVDVKFVEAEIRMQKACNELRNKSSHGIEMAYVPRIYNVERNEDAGEFRIVMENGGYPLVNVLTDEITDAKVREYCIVLFQVASLLDMLQRNIHFTHRDVHVNNVILKPSSSKSQCGDPVHKVYLIDFGMARTDTDSSRTFFNDDDYVPGFDMTLLVYRVFDSVFRCRTTDGSCETPVPTKVAHAFRDLLQQTGVDFKLYDEDIAGLYNGIYTSMKLRDPSTVMAPKNVREFARDLFFQLCPSVSPVIYEKEESKEKKIPAAKKTKTRSVPRRSLKKKRPRRSLKKKQPRRSKSKRSKSRRSK